MSDQNVTVRVEAKGVGDLGKPFDDLSGGARKAENTLKGLSKEVGQFSKGVGNIQSGLLGLSIGAGALPESVGKAVVSLNLLSSTARALKGVALVGAGTGLGAGVLGGLAVGVTALGAAAVIASPSLQNKLGGAILSVTGKAKEAEEAIKRMMLAGQEIRLARGMGVGTLAEENKSAAEIGIRRPYLGRIADLKQQSAGLDSSAALLRGFPNRGYDPTQEALGNLGRRPEDFAENLRTLKGLQQRPFRDFNPALRREQFGEQDSLEYLKGRKGLAASALGDIEERQRLQARLMDISGTGKNRVAMTPEERGAESQRIVGRMKELGGGSAKPPTAADAQEARNQLDAANEKVIQQTERVEQVKRRVAQAEADHLKMIQGSVVEQRKLAEETIRSEQARLKGLKVGLAFEDPGSLRKIADISRKIAGGEELSRGELEFAKTKDVFNEKVTDIGERKAAGSPIIKEILQNVGAEKKLEEAQKAKEAFIKLDTELKTQVDVRLKLDVEEANKAITEAIKPVIADAVKDLKKNMEQAIRSASTIEFFKQILGQDRRAQEAAQN